jgi:hypothetical protein
VEPALSDASSATLEQARAAAGQFERAQQMLARGGDPDYARQLLFSCCSLDPANLTYRQTLRHLLQAERRRSGLRWFGTLSDLGLMVRLSSARRSKDYGRVLEQGEKVLARYPGDVSTHLEMAEAAEALGFPELAIWLLMQGRKQVPDNTALMRALALLHEKVGQLSQAIALWELVREAEPDDYQVHSKINSLSVNDHIAKSRYRRRGSPL